MVWRTAASKSSVQRMSRRRANVLHVYQSVERGLGDLLVLIGQQAQQHGGGIRRVELPIDARGQHAHQRLHGGDAGDFADIAGQRRQVQLLDGAARAGEAAGRRAAISSCRQTLARRPWPPMRRGDRRWPAPFLTLRCEWPTDADGRTPVSIAPSRRRSREYSRRWPTAIWRCPRRANRRKVARAIDRRLAGCEQLQQRELLGRERRFCPPPAPARRSRGRRRRCGWLRADSDRCRRRWRRCGRWLFRRACPEGPAQASSNSRRTSSARIVGHGKNVVGVLVAVAAEDAHGQGPHGAVVAIELIDDRLAPSPPMRSSTHRARARWLGSSSVSSCFERRARSPALRQAIARGPDTAWPGSGSSSPRWRRRRCRRGRAFRRARALCRSA